MTSLKLTAVGTSTGVVIPKEMLQRMKVGRGDYLHVAETAEGYVMRAVRKACDRIFGKRPIVDVVVMTI